LKREVPKTAVIEVEVELSSVVVEVVEEPLSLLHEMIVRIKRRK